MHVFLNRFNMFGKEDCQSSGDVSYKTRGQQPDYKSNPTTENV